MKVDFSGYVTKNDIRCADGRVIKENAFKHNDGIRVPLVWKHNTDSPDNILGNVTLENRPDGVYGYAKFNDSPKAQTARAIVKHGDMDRLSIFANNLIQKSMDVIHGNIREVSLVVSGANPGARIDNVNLAHGADQDFEDDEAVIHSGEYLTLSLAHEDDKAEDDSEDENEDDEETVQDVLDSMTEKQRDVALYLVGNALDAGKEAGTDPEAKHGDNEEEPSNDSDEESEISHSKEDQDMARNVFENQAAQVTQGATLTHDDAVSIFDRARALGSVKEAVDEYAFKHGIEDIGVLFPDAKDVTQTPELLKRQTAWVSKVLDATTHTPFSRIRSKIADLTPEEARAKGYITGNMKKEEFFKVSKRVTGPTTIYKKQKLDRDDIIDITDFDVVAWLKAEMRLMLNEEVARAILVGDNRSIGDDDKVNEENIRPIATDSELYQTTIFVQLDGTTSAEEIVDALTLQRRHYRGSGSPSFFTTEEYLAKLLLAKDGIGRRLYQSVADVAAALRVSEVVPVEVMEEYTDLIGILVDLRDYNIGTNKGGDISLFDDFDIDYNQYKYLIETRMSGALVKPKSALVVRKAAADATLVTPEAPIVVDNVVTVPTVTGVIYKNKMTSATITESGPVTITSGESLTIVAMPASSSYYFATSADDEWTFVYDGE